MHASAEHSLFVQAYGTKHWFIYPPTYDQAVKPEILRAPYFSTLYDPDRPDYLAFPSHGACALLGSCLGTR